MVFPASGDVGFVRRAEGLLISCFQPLNPACASQLFAVATNLAAIRLGWAQPPWRLSVLSHHVTKDNVPLTRETGRLGQTGSAQSTRLAQATPSADPSFR